MTFGLHLRAWERDVVMHTLPTFHANGWGIPYLAAGVGATQVVLRKVDGPEILRRVAAHGVTLMGAAPTVWNTVLDAARDAAGEIPGRGRVRIVGAGAPPPARTIQRVTDELGWEFLQIYGLTETAPLLTFNRARAADDALPAAERAAKLSRAGAPRSGCGSRPTAPARSSPGATSSWPATGTTPRRSMEVLQDGWFHTGDGGRVDGEGHLTIADRKKDVIITGPRTSRRSRSRTRSSATRRWPRSP